jgi:hypothetical protein
LKNKKFYLTLLFTFILTSITATQVTAQQTKVYINPETQTIPQPGLSFTVEITIQNVNDLYGWELKIYYPNSILNATDAVEGTMLKKDGALTFFRKHIFTDNYNETHGLVNLFCLIAEAEAPGVNGNGILATVTFNTTSAGTAKIYLSDVKLSDSNVNPIPCLTSDGTVTVVPEFPTVYILPTLIVSALTIILLRKNMHKQKSKASKANS